MFGFLKKDTPAPPETIPEGAIPFLEASDLLSPHKPLIKKIRDDSGASKDFFDRYYLPAIERLAEILQLRPFGHSGPYVKKGGAIEVAIKRAALALKLRQGALLPLNCKPEEISHRGEAWTYAVFTAALLREFGGQLMSVKIIGFNRVDKPKGEWHGWYEPLNKYHHYRMKKNENVSRSLSQTSSIMHMTDILPAHALEWMYNDLELMDNLLDLLSGANKIRDNPIQALTIKASVTLKDEITFDAAEKRVESKSHDETGERPNESIDTSTGEVIKGAGEKPRSSQQEEPPPEMPPAPDTEAEYDSTQGFEPEPESPPVPAADQPLMEKIRSDIETGVLPNEKAEIHGDNVHIMYPSALKQYSESPALLLDELRTMGAVVEEMERKGRSLDRKIILK